MKILITGANGRLGKELSKLFPDALTPSVDEFNIIHDKEYIKKEAPDVIIHLAALTSVEKCEKDKKLAWETNVIGTKNLTDGYKGYFIYMSTPCVFSGKEEKYNEESIPNPSNFYGLSKLLGEMSVPKDGLIIRANFVPREKWLYPKAFTDRYGTYLFADQLAVGIKDVVDKRESGKIHIVGDKKISMFELAKITTPDILPITLSEYNGPQLTKDMSLDSLFYKKYNIYE